MGHRVRRGQLPGGMEWVLGPQAFNMNILKILIWSFYLYIVIFVSPFIHFPFWFFPFSLILIHFFAAWRSLRSGGQVQSKSPSLVMIPFSMPWASPVLGSLCPIARYHIRTRPLLAPVVAWLFYGIYFYFALLHIFFFSSFFAEMPKHLD